MATQLATYSIQDGFDFSQYSPYGLYNPFRVLVRNPDAGKFKLKYRIKVTLPDATFYELDVEPVGGVANLDPLQGARDLYFESELNVEDSVNERVKSYNKVSIQAGQIYADAADEPATFQGYDSPTLEVLLYNGYIKGILPINYVPEDWYTTKPIKVPMVQKTLYYMEGQEFMLYAPSALPTQTGALNYNNNLTGYRRREYQADGTLITATEDQYISLSQTDLGYWPVKPTMFTSESGSYIIINYIYGTPIDEGDETEPITIRRYECANFKQPITLFWLNRFSTPEMLNFASFEESIDITKGKRVIKSRYDAAATVLTSVLINSSQDYKEYGNSYTRKYKLRSSWLTENQLAALEDLYVSPAVQIGAESLTNIIGTSTQSVKVLGNSYTILDVKEGLQRVEVEVEEQKIQPIIQR